MKVSDLKIFSLGFGASLPALPNSKGPGRQRTTPAGAALRDAHREIVLPRADDDSGGQDGGRPQILLVEEDRRFFELVEWILADGAPEFALVHAPRLSAALAVLTRQPIRLVLTDLRLPDSTGPATVRHLARAAPNVPLIVLSGVSDIEVALACVRDGAEELVVKQALDSEALIRLIRITLERRRRLAEQWAAGYDDPLTGVRGPAALEAVGRQFLKVSDRTGLAIGALVLRAEGQGTSPAGEPARIVELAAVVRQTVRRCDVIARVEPNELALILVGDRPGFSVASTRLQKALVTLPSRGQLRMGVADYDRRHPETIQELLALARDSLRPVQA